MGRWRGRIWAAWFDLLALTLNAQVPVYLAFDLAEVLGPPQCAAHVEGEDAERHLLALVAGLSATLSFVESESVGAPAAYRSRAPPFA